MLDPYELVDQVLPFPTLDSSGKAQLHRVHHGILSPALYLMNPVCASGQSEKIQRPQNTAVAITGLKCLYSVRKETEYALALCEAGSSLLASHSLIIFSEDFWLIHVWRGLDNRLCEISLAQEHRWRETVFHHAPLLTSRLIIALSLLSRAILRGFPFQALT